MAVDRESLNRLKIDRPTAGDRSGWAGALIVVIIVLLLAGGGYWWWQRPTVTEVETTLARQETTIGGARTLLNASGYVTARREATVSSKITGLVTDVLIEEGTVVEAGQILARLDDSNVRTNLELAEAQLQAARDSLGETEANLELARRNLKRTRDLAEARVVSDAELDQADAAVEALRARLERQRADVAVAEKQVQVWKQQLADTVIRAPFAGVVTSKNAQPGEMISPISAGGGFTRTGICTIVDMASLEVEVDVNESYINRVFPGQPVSVTLDSYPDWTIDARVIAIVPTADRQKATVRVRVGFDELDPRILPDMGLKVAFKDTAEPGQAATSTALATVLVPRTSISRIDGSDIVWVVRDGRVERRAVTIDRSLGEDVAIAAGVRAGERVVLRPPRDLHDGAKVTEISMQS